MFCHCCRSQSCRTTKALSDKLFAQLDFDGSGGISFKEFLIGLEKMVMEEFEDADGEEVRDCQFQVDLKQ